MFIQNFISVTAAEILEDITEAIRCQGSWIYRDSVLMICVS